jgi:hypothetical protein
MRVHQLLRSIPLLVLAALIAATDRPETPVAAAQSALGSGAWTP